MTEGKSALNILQVCTSDFGGGAERSAFDLFEAYRRQGHNSYLAVGYKRTVDPHVIPIHHPAGRRFWARMNYRFRLKLRPLSGKVRGVDRLQTMLRWGGEPGAFFDYIRGHEDFHYPESWRLLEIIPKKPDIVHCHNLHGGFFDLRSLKQLSKRVPVILNLRDEWLLTGHCSYAMECTRWKTGCGRCPDLVIYPAIRRDATDHNWRVKANIYRSSRLYIATPSQWLMAQVRQSMLGGCASRVIFNGTDLSVFQPASSWKARELLGLPLNSRIVLFVGNRIKGNRFKDFPTIINAVEILMETRGIGEVLFVCLGESGQDERIGNGRIQYRGYERSRDRVAKYYQAADLYIHAARAEVFGKTITEALACGTPVVATAVGGIPEVVKGLAREGNISGQLKENPPSRATGILTPAGDARAMAKGIETVLADDALRRRLSENAAKDSRERFSLERQTMSFLDWYEEIIEDWKANASHHPGD